ncbi:MAG: sensor histidine kinase [Candidatus Limivivens sp.]|nr:sensor histidine kinase [Candidatus Limivivens sp.]
MKEKRKAVQKPMTFYKKLMMTFAGIFLTTALVIVVASAAITRRITVNNYYSYSHQAMKELNQRMEVIMNDIEVISRFVLSDERIQDYLTTDTLDSSYNTISREAKEMLMKLVMDRQYVESVVVYDKKGNGLMSGNGDSIISDYNVLQSQPWYQEVLEKQGMYLWVRARFQGISADRERVVLARVINETDTLNAAGTVIFILRDSYFTDMLNEARTPAIGDIFIMDRDGGILFAPSSADEGQRNTVLGQYQKLLENGGDTMQTRQYHLTSCPAGDLGWTLFCMNKKSMVSSSWYTNMLIILIASVIALILAVIVYSRFAKNINGVVQGLVTAMGKAKEQRYKEEIQIPTDTVEFAGLVDEYNRMIRSVNVLVNQVMQEKINTKQAQLENLQSRINPHFLYNTLDCINWKAMANNQDEISEMIVGLSKMFRFSLGKGEKEVKLSEELENIRCYLMLQQKRFEDQLSFLIDAPESAANYRVMKFILQPLVENSIIHGLQEKGEKGYVSVIVKEEEEYLELSVLDNGVGIDEEYVQDIISGSVSEGNGRKHRHGIYNVNERLKMRYGEESALQFRNRSRGGTKVSIRLSKKKLEGK